MNDQQLAGPVAGAQMLADNTERIARDLQRTFAAGESAFAAGRDALDAGKQFWVTIRPLVSWLATLLEDDAVSDATARAHRTARRAVSA